MKKAREQSAQDLFSRLSKGRQSDQGTMWLDSGRPSMDPVGRVSKEPEWEEHDFGRPSSDARIMVRNGFDHKDI